MLISYKINFLISIQGLACIWGPLEFREWAWESQHINSISLSFSIYTTIHLLKIFKNFKILLQPFSLFLSWHICIIELASISNQFILGRTPFVRALNIFCFSKGYHKQYSYQINNAKKHIHTNPHPFHKGDDLRYEDEPNCSYKADNTIYSSHILSWDQFG